tara:strand:+ start:347 stop:565 length:219 start_codon:yes stop_codon:yes gene_type:complete
LPYKVASIFPAQPAFPNFNIELTLLGVYFSSGLFLSNWRTFPVVVFISSRDISLDPSFSKLNLKSSSLPENM